jgi:O-antigen ligase
VGTFFLFKEPIKDTLFRFFDGLNTKTLDQRYSGWVDGLTNFIEHPPLGVGFFHFDGYKFNNFSTGFVPPRYHNTIIQFLASTGFLGLIAYGFHRYQTIRITFKKPTLEKTFIFLSISALLLASLVDNNFFNLGPGLNYCVALACIEGINIQNDVKIKWFKKVQKS